MRYGPGGVARCECCGETTLDFLTLEHPDRDGARDRAEVMGSSYGKNGVGGSAYYRRLIRLGLPDKNLTVLCFNCQWGRVISGVCPHRKPSPS
jgi:hypothetical protein